MEKTPSLENTIENKIESKPLVSVVIPAYNEEAIVTQNLTKICEYLKSIEPNWGWEIIFVNDGSTDNTGVLADEFARSIDNFHVLHHFVNYQIGQALRFAFNNCKGSYVVTLDLDLSYSPEHIGVLLQTIIETKAKIVIASPYMKGGEIINVPWLRRNLSIFANRFLSVTAKGNLTTLTGMVRAYDRKFICSLNLKAMDNEINPEIIYKAQLLRARIVEIPARLDWSFQRSIGKKRKSSMKISRSVISNLLAGFLFRPFMFFVLPGLFLFLFSLYPILWALIHTFTEYRKLSMVNDSVILNISESIEAAFTVSPQSFIIGGISLIFALQLISLGIISLQSKRYFEELFHLGTGIYRSNLKE